MTKLVMTGMVAAGAAGLSVATVARGADFDLRPFEASYGFHYKGMYAANTTLTLTQAGADRWTYRSAGEARGLYKMLPIDSPAQSSELTVDSSGIKPLRFTQANGSSQDRAIDIRFDWQTSRVNGTVETKPVDEPVPTGTQDDLSVQLALLRALARGESKGDFSTYGDRGLRGYRFKVEGDETIKTELGEVATRILVTERDGSPRITRYWCAPAYGYLPLRVEQRRLDAVEWTLEIRTLKRS
jgi:hypothetical protein